ncbi:hypothetical protein shn_00860 [Shinella sp. HZN7]|nr:hypothetical protein shn_00860 [Shinella sp. HZN7]
MPAATVNPIRQFHDAYMERNKTMTKTLSTTFVTALLAASVYGSTAALAGGDGDYYRGIDRDQAQSETVDRITTQSIGSDDKASTSVVVAVGPARGDYYSGLDRDNR